MRLGEHTWYQTVDCNDDHDCAPPVRDYKVECVVWHQNYNEKTELHNIALIRLGKNVVFEGNKRFFPDNSLPLKPFNLFQITFNQFVFR